MTLVGVLLQGQGLITALLGSTLAVSVVGMLAGIVTIWMQRATDRETRTDTFNQARRSVYENYLKHLDTLGAVGEAADERKKWRREYLEHSALLASVARRNVFDKWVQKPVYEDPEQHFNGEKRRLFVVLMNKDLNPEEHKR